MDGDYYLPCIIGWPLTLKYQGDQTGPTSTINLCSPEQSLPRHFLIPSKAQEPQGSEDKRYLEFKGVYSFPKQSTADDLLRAYFHHVHPIMPIVEADIILDYHRRRRLYDYNVLLLWSIFTIATNVKSVVSRVWWDT